MKPISYRTPGGEYSPLYLDMAKQPHLLIAGATGSGKSVVINGILSALLTQCSPARCRLILIDPKRVELSIYRSLPHTLYYASEPGEPTAALRYALSIIDERFTMMQKEGTQLYSGSDVYIVIDELADLMTTEKKTVQPLLQRIAQIGRAARVHIIAGTQRPTTDVIAASITVNMDARVGLRTRCKQDSRNILGLSGCEQLPRYGQGYYSKPEGIQRYQLPMISRETITNQIRYWTSSACIA